MRKTTVHYLSAFVFSLTLFGTPALAEDVAKGKKVFKRCKACHYSDKEKNKTGPYLVNVIGRKAGIIEGYKYSKAMRESQLVWDEATMTAYLKAPRKFLKGTKMVFAGLKKETDIKNLIAYLKTQK